MFKRLALLIGALLMAAATPAHGDVPSKGAGQAVRPGVDPQVAAIFADFPNGGPDMAAALEALLEADPELVEDVRRAAQDATPDQTSAAREAIASSQTAGSGEASAGQSRGRGEAPFAGPGNFGGGGGAKVSPN
jgi:uncharacterized membrane protein YgcG